MHNIASIIFYKYIHKIITNLWTFFQILKITFQIDILITLLIPYILTYKNYRSS